MRTIVKIRTNKTFVQVLDTFSGVQEHLVDSIQTYKLC